MNNQSGLKTSWRLVLSVCFIAIAFFFSTSVIAAGTSQSGLQVDPFMMGVGLVNQGKPAEAKVYFDQVIKTDPGRAGEIHSLLAKAYLIARQPDRAIEEYKQALQLKPGNSLILLNLAQAYQLAGNFSEVEDIYDELMLRNPDSAVYPYNLANLLLQRKRYEEAISFFDLALKKNPHVGKNIYLQYAFANEKNKNFPEAIDAYKKYMEVNPTDYRGYYNIANIYFRTSKFNEAKDYYLKALEVNPQAAEVLTNLSFCYYYERDYSTAQKYLEQALKVNPDLPQAVFGMSMLYNKNKNFEKALELAQQAKSLGLKVSDNYLQHLTDELNSTVEKSKQKE